MALGGDTRALEMVNALARMLDRGFIQTSDLQLLSRRLEWFSDSGYWEMYLSDDGLDQASLFACALSDDPNLWRRLGTMLLRRLAPNAPNGSLWVDHLDNVHWSTGGNWPPPSRYEDLSTARLLASMPQSFWTTLREHPDQRLRDLAVVTDPETTPWRLRQLATRPHPASLACNASVAPEVLARFATDTHGVQAGVADNLSADAPTLTKLASHDSWIVRWRVAENPSTSKAVLTRLICDENLEVRNAASRRLPTARWQPSNPRRAAPEHRDWC